MSEVHARYVRTHVRLHVPTRASDHIPEHFIAFMVDDVSENITALMPEQVPEHCVNDMSGSVCHTSLSIHLPCLLPNRPSGWGLLEEE